MNTDTIKVLIETVPALIIYIVPGYIVLWIIGFMVSKNADDNEITLFKSIVVSYPILTFLNLILGIWGLNIFDSKVLKVVTVFFSIFIGYAYSKLILCDWFRSMLRKKGVTRSVQTYFLNDIVDKEYGNWATVYIPSEKIIYKGKVREFEEKDGSENSYIVLSNYTLISYDAEELLKYEDDNRYRVLINTKDVSRIELYYHESSKNIKED